MIVPRPVVVATQRVDPRTFARLSEFSHAVANASSEPWPEAERRATCRDAEGLMVFMPDRVDEAFLSACPRLKVIAGALKGYDNFDVEACTRRGIWFTVVPDLLTDATAELVVGLLIGLARHVTAGDRFVRSGEFRGWRPRFYGVGLLARRAGLIGYGRVGRAVARRLHAFGTEVVYHDRSPVDSSAEGVDAARRVELDTARQVNLDELLSTSDFVIPLVPLTPETHLLLNADRLRRLKPGALVINVARGSLVDEEEVAAALQAGRLGGYAADVFAMEDWARPDRPAAIPTRLLTQTDRTLFTPHLGSAVADVRLAIELHAAGQIEQALRGARPDGALNDPAPADRRTPVTGTPR